MRRTWTFNRTIFFISIIAFTLYILIFLPNVIYGQTIYIVPDNLAWYNFKGKVDPSSPWIANTKTALNADFGHAGPIHYDPDNPPKIQPRLIQDSSWVNYTKLRSLTIEKQSYLFKHEKIHYLLAIIEAKRLKQELLSKKFKYFAEFSKAFLMHGETINKRSKLYDNETNHSLNENAQLEWELNINKELYELKDVQIDL